MTWFLNRSYKCQSASLASPRSIASLLAREISSLIKSSVTLLTRTGVEEANLPIWRSAWIILRMRAGGKLKLLLVFIKKHYEGLCLNI